MRADSQPVQCEKCLKTFNTKPGWKYHVDNGVCDLKSPQLSVEEAALAYEASRDSNGSGRKRKAARRAASVLAAAVAAGREDDDDGGGGGGGGGGDNEDDGDFSEISSSGSVSDGGSDDDDSSDNDVNGDDDDDDEVDERASAKKRALLKSKKRKAALAAARRRKASKHGKGTGAAVPYWQQSRQSRGRGGSQLTVGGYSATAFTHSGPNSGRSGSSARAPSDLVLEGKGESAAAAMALSTADDDSSSTSSGTVGGGRGAQEGRGLKHAKMLAAVARARLDRDLEPGARQKSAPVAPAGAPAATAAAAAKKAKRKKKADVDDDGDGEQAEGGGSASHRSRGAAVDDADAWGVEDEEEVGGVPQKRSWREVPEIRRFVVASRKGGAAGEAPWEVRNARDKITELHGRRLCHNNDRHSKRIKKRWCFAIPFLIRCVSRGYRPSAFAAFCRCYALLFLLL